MKTRTKRNVKVDIRAALDELPRYNTTRGPYRIDGRYCMTNTRALPAAADRALRLLMKRVDALGYPARIERVDVNGTNLEVIHRHLRVRSLVWLYKRAWSWQDWPQRKLPIILKWKGRLIMWNGHHRCTFCRLAQRKLRALVFDLDGLAAWNLKHPGGVGHWKVIKERGKKRA